MDKKITQTLNVREYFYERIKSAVVEQKVAVSTDVEFYLVNILSHFSLSENLFTRTETASIEYRPLAFKLYDAVFTNEDRARFNHLKSLGDTALYHAGVFSEHLYTKTNEMDYYMNMGVTAYRSLANLSTSMQSQLEAMFKELSERFESLVEIISVCCERDIVSNSDVLALIERYMKTGSERARSQLNSQGITTDLIITNKTMQ